MSEKDNSEEVKFISLDEAASMKSGTRVTFIPGMQALYAEALKNICYVKKVPLIRALHPLMGVNKETGEAITKKNVREISSSFWVDQKKIGNSMLPTFTKKVVKYLESNL